MRIVRARPCGSASVVSIAIAPLFPSSITFGGRSATPCEVIVRRRSTGSPPAPTSSSSADQRFAIVWSNALEAATFPLPHALTRTIAPPSVRDVKRNVVCISHDTGAGGSEIGRLVAERLGFRYIDEDLVAHAAARGGVDPRDIADEERRKSLLARLFDNLSGSGGAEAWSTLGYVPSAVERGPTSDDLRALILEAIDETAARGNAVIVSHAASHAIAGRADVLRVLVTASASTRVARLREADGLEESLATRAIKEADAARADYLKRFHEVDEEAPTQYDLVLNTDQLSVEEAAELVSAAATTVV